MDFNSMFALFVKGRGHKHIHEDDLPKIYDEWMDTPSADLRGISPREYLSQLTTGELLDLAAVPQPAQCVMDELLKRDCNEELRAAAMDENEDLVFSAIEIMNLKGISQPYGEYVFRLPMIESDELRESIVTLLKENAEQVKEQLFTLASDGNFEIKSIVAEILTRASRDERTYELLRTLFAQGENVPYICSLISAYGDERLAPPLYRALESADYVDYIEIRNAIESLGGVVDDTRDFSADPLFKTLCGGNQDGGK